MISYSTYQYSFVKFFLGVLFLLIILFLPSRGDSLKDLKLERCFKDNIKDIRLKGKIKPPKNVSTFLDKYSQYCEKRATSEIEAHGRWFYCEDKKEFGGDIRWDEVVTYRIYSQLLDHYGSLEKLPGYTPARLKKARLFWQKWQKPNGSWINHLTRKGTPRQCNGKYVGVILKLLNTNPLYQTTGHGAFEIDTQKCFREIAARKMNHGTAHLSSMLNQIQDGNVALIPAFERAVELAMREISNVTGMFHGPNGKGGYWNRYGATAETMKGLLRLIAYLGLENIPYRSVRADSLIENQKPMRAASLSVKRNTAEMFVQCMLESPYRNKELLEALKKHSVVILKNQPHQSHVTGDYAAYVLQIFGPFLHWEGYEDSTPRTRFYQGMQNDYRVEVGPYGRAVNLIPKKPEEKIDHPEWSYEKCNLRMRNLVHRSREIIEIVPASASTWDKNIRSGVISMNFSLEDLKLENPYIKLRWSGDNIEILLNDVPVKRKIGEFKDYGAICIPSNIVKSLKVGVNKLSIRPLHGKEIINLSAGIIDWKVAKASSK